MKQIQPFLFITTLCLLWPVDSYRMQEDTSKGRTLSLSIDQVQVYSRQALVRRSGPVEIEKGSNQFVIQDLPAKVRDDSVRVFLADGAGVKIQTIRVETEHKKVFKTKEAREAEQLLKKARSKLRLLTDEYNALHEERNFLKGIQFAKVPEDKKENRRELDPKRWQETLGFVTTSLEANHKSMQNLLNDIDLARAEMSVALMVADRHSSSKALRKKSIFIALERKGPSKRTRLHVEYRLSGAEWYPAYTARVLSTKKTDCSEPCKADVRLVGHALVRNETGEDWNDVALTFSAADPEDTVAVARLPQWKISSRILETEEELDEDEGFFADEMPNVAQSERMISAHKKRKQPAPKPVQQAQELQRPSPEPNDGLLDNLNSVRKGASDYYSENSRAVRDKRARKKSEAVEKNLGDFRSNLVAQERAVNRGDYRETLRRSEMILENIRTLEGEYQKYFLEEERQARELKQKSLKMLEMQDLLGRLVVPRSSSRGFDYRYEAKIAEDIRSDGAFRKILFAEKDLSADLIYESAPERRDLAFLTGNVSYTEETPLLAGPVSVFHNQDYVGEARLDNVSAKEPFQLHLGSDENILIARRTKELRVKSGLFTDTYSFDREIVITVKNRKKSGIVLDIFDRLPVSTDERIKITDIRFSLAPTRSSKEGLHRFRIELEAGGEKTISIKYKLTHPADVLPVSGSSGGPTW